jgi:hypothetical protein
MDKRILYQNDDGGVSIIIPTPEALQLYTIDQIAKKDVPEGEPYKIVDVTNIPTDREFRNAWEVDAADLTDGVGAEWSVIPEETTDD